METEHDDTTKELEWTGPYKDQRAVLPDGRTLRVWWADPRWKSSIGEKKAAKRGVDYTSKDAARAAVLKEAGIP